MFRLVARTLIATVLLVGSAEPARRPSLVMHRLVYHPGLVLDRYETEPRFTATTGTVLLVHGCCGDRRDLAPLARTLARRGAKVFNADVHAVGHGGGWPSTYLDVVCAVAAITAEGVTATELTLVGWDDGALVASAVLLGWSTVSTFASECRWPIPVDGPKNFVGLSGHYGWVGDVPSHLLTGETIEWFGGDPRTDPVAWNLGNPSWWGLHRQIGGRIPRVLLLGTDSDLSSRDFAALLANDGVSAEARLLGPGTHSDLILPRGVLGFEAVDLIARWMNLPSQQLHSTGPDALAPAAFRCVEVWT
jgi:hypothetical protein